MILVNKGEEPISSVWQGPGDDGVTLLVIGIARLQLPLGGGGAVAHPLEINPDFGSFVSEVRPFSFRDESNTPKSLTPLHCGHLSASN